MGCANEVAGGSVQGKCREKFPCLRAAAALHALWRARPGLLLPGRNAGLCMPLEVTEGRSIFSGCLFEIATTCGGE